MSLKLKNIPSLKFYHIIYFCVAILVAVSVIASYSLTGELWQPILQGLGGFALMIVVSKINYQKINRFYQLFFVLAFLLLILTVIFGRGGGGRSLSLGFMSFQTFYLVTIFYLFYLCTKSAYEMSNNIVLDGKKAAVRLSVFAIFTGLIAMRNISTAMLLFGTGLLVLYVSGIKLKYLGIFMLAIMLAGGLYIGGSALKDKGKSEQVQTEETKTRGGTGYNRIKYWLTGESDVEGYGRQMTLARTAVARSAHLPQPGKGIIKDKMPEGENDFVFSLICEELSVWTGIGLLVLYFFIFFNITFLISRKAKGNFVKLYSLAIALLMLGQVFIHVGTNINLIPATGQTLPFVSRGATALFATFFIFGTLINMGKQVLMNADADDTDLNIESPIINPK
ncbi:MAG: FtsW/RodA/SpoVE family cell cycle protein [Bacteroidales bacterium]|jgi:cell division protein FtsW|nr:FtsW/RodA/SpoVE family cell cycle protein [Bacteroidales bacterium]